jgi:hypothetical protein
MAEGEDFVELFQAVVAIAVSVIPEGLPALITITLAIGVQRMVQRATPSSGACLRWKRSARCHGSAPTRRAR